MYNNKKSSAVQTHQILSADQHEEHAFVRQRMAQLTAHLVDFDEQDFSQRPEPDKANPCILDDANLPKSGPQPLTQEQMREACNTIRERVQQDSVLNDSIGFCAEISFLDFTQKCKGDIFYLSDATFYFRGINDETATGCVFLEWVRMDVHVLIGEYNGANHAFIEAKRPNGKDHIYELLEFGLLSTFEVDGRSLDIMTIFNKSFGTKIFEVIPNSIRKNHWPRTDIPTDALPPRNRGDYIVMGDICAKN